VFSPTTGFPALNVPMGYTRDNTLPAGITFFGKAWSEATLIRLAYSYEQATYHRHPPSSVPATFAPKIKQENGRKRKLISPFLSFSCLILSATVADYRANCSDLTIRAKTSSYVPNSFSGATPIM
jgi:hypothetical protein